MPGDANLCIHSRGRFFKGERHVVSQIRATLPSLPAASSPPSAQYLVEPKKVSENILKFFEDAGIETGIEPAASQSGSPVAVVHRALLRVGKNRVSFAGRPKTFFRFRLLFQITVRVILQSSFAIRRFNLFGRSFARHSQYFVEIFGIRCGHRSLFNWYSNATN